MLTRPPSPALFPYTTLFRSDQFSTVFWDVFGEQGHPVRATVTEMGPLLLARMLDLNDVQEGVLIVEIRSEEHTSELQSRRDLVCRLLLEKKKTKQYISVLMR